MNAPANRQRIWQLVGLISNAMGFGAAFMGLALAILYSTFSSLSILCTIFLTFHTVWGYYCWLKLKEWDNLLMITAAYVGRQAAKNE